MNTAALRMEVTAPTLPVGSIGHKSLGWWGVLALIATEAALFAYLLFSYYYYALQSPPTWMAQAHLSLKLSAPNTVILLLSSVAVWWSERGARKDRRGQLLLGLGIGVVLGVLFLVIQFVEWRQQSFGLQDGPYGALFYTTTGFHMAHVAVGVVALALVWLWAALGLFDRTRDTPVLIASIYWHFVDAVWLTVWFTYYLSPWLIDS